MAKKPRGIILYESDPSGKTKALEDYLQMSATYSKTPCLVVTWSREDVMNGPGPKKALNFANCTINGSRLADDTTLKLYPISFISESGATLLVKSGVTTDDAMKQVISYMALPDYGRKPELEEAFTQIVKTKGLFKDNNKDKNTVLILFRDTGSLGGAYPELDSGDAMTDLIAVVEKMNMTPILAGNEKPYGKTASIGAYWTLLAQVVKVFNLPVRDVEAYFMRWAFTKGYFNMVLGFRSGVLDSFTFLGVPTVSVGLRFLAGEDRHEELAQDVFKRVNIAYDQARHNATAWVRFRSRDAKESRVILQSPFWLGQSPEGVTQRPAVDRNTSLKTPPSVFHGFDATVLDRGFRVACEKDLGMEKTVNCAVTRVFNVSTARKTFYVDKTHPQEDKQAYFSGLEALDNETLADHSHLDRIASLQERAAETDFYMKESDRDWGSNSVQIDLTYSEYAREGSVEKNDRK